MTGRTDETPSRPILPGRKQKPPKPQPKPEYVLPFTPPVLFYRRPDDLNHGIVETLAEMPEASVAIDPLARDYRGRLDWSDFLRACWARGRKVYGWTRVWDPETWDAYLTLAAQLGLAGHFPNIEDDDLRSYPPVKTAVLQQIAASNPVGVLGNYFISGEWPISNPLAHLPVLPEWFPREITDPTATLEGSLDSGRRHFAAAVPLLDGREERGLAAFPYPAGAFCVWPADNVTDWSKWRRN